MPSPYEYGRNEYNPKGDSANGKVGSMQNGSIANATMQQGGSKGGSNPFSAMLDHAQLFNKAVAPQIEQNFAPKAPGWAHNGPNGPTPAGNQWAPWSGNPPSFTGGPDAYQVPNYGKPEFKVPTPNPINNPITPNIPNEGGFGYPQVNIPSEAGFGVPQVSYYPGQTPQVSFQPGGVFNPIEIEQPEPNNNPALPPTTPPGTGLPLPVANIPTEGGVNIPPPNKPVAKPQDPPPNKPVMKPIETPEPVNNPAPTNPIGQVPAEPIPTNEQVGGGGSLAPLPSYWDGGRTGQAQAINQQEATPNSPSPQTPPTSTPTQPWDGGRASTTPTVNYQPVSGQAIGRTPDGQPIYAPPTPPPSAPSAPSPTAPAANAPTGTSTPPPATPSATPTGDPQNYIKQLMENFASTQTGQPQQQATDYGKFFNPMFAQQREDLQRSMRAEAAKTGAIDSGGYLESSGRAMADLAGKQSAQLGGLQFEANEAAQERNLKTQLAQLESNTRLKEVATENGMKRYIAELDAELTREGMNLQKFLANEDNVLKRYGIDQNVFIAKLQAETGLSQAQIQAGATVSAAGLHAAASQAASAAASQASLQEAQLRYQLGLYQTDVEREHNMGTMILGMLGLQGQNNKDIIGTGPASLLPPGLSWGDVIGQMWGGK